MIEEKDFLDTELGKKVKKIELLLLNEVIRVCKKYNIKYFADSGTLLGAVRHKGFIPWDDDIDLVMLRDDYEKFINLSNEFKSPFFLQTAYTDKNYSRGHAQIRYDGTAMMLPAEKDSVEYHQGIFIDIFPLDTYPLLKESKDKFLRKIRFHQIINALTSISPKFYKGHHPFIYIIVHCLVPFKIHFKYYEKLCSKYNGKEGYLDKIAWRPSTMRIYKMNQSWYKDIILLPFEGLTIPCPIGYKEVLTEMYGPDYMTPVKNASTHGSLIISVDKSFYEFTAQSSR